MHVDQIKGKNPAEKSAGDRKRAIAAIFDLDGILINSEGTQYKGWKIALQPLGILLSKEQYLK